MGSELTRKYVFQCALAGEPVQIEKENFGDREEMLACGLIEPTEAEGMYRVLHKIMVVYRDDYRNHYMQQGTMLHFRHKRLRKP